MDYTIKANTNENRLYVTIKCALTDDNIVEYLDIFNREFDKLKPGMTVLFDMREAKVFSLSVASKTESNKQRCIDGGLSKAAMVVSSAIFKGQMNRSYNKDVDVRDSFFDNVEDAIAYLNS